MIPVLVDADLAATEFPQGELQAAAALVVAQDGRLLLQRRTPPYRRAGMVNGWGGGREAGESLTATIVRELDEELRAKVAADDLTYLGATRRMLRQMTIPQVMAFFLWHDKDGQVTTAYEGELVIFADATAALAEPNISFTTRWALETSVAKGLL